MTENLTLQLNTSISNQTNATYGLRIDCVKATAFMSPGYTIPPAVLSVIVNFVLFYATHKSKKKLQRHNYFYFCVANTLIINMLLLLLIIWILIIYETGLLDTVSDLQKNSRVAHLKNTVWVVGNSLLTTIPIVMGGNICTFLIVLMDSAYVVGRTLNREASELTNQLLTKQSGSQNWFRITRKKSALLIGALSWLYAIVVVAVAATGWNCLHTNQCCTAAYHIGYECHRDSECSYFAAPLKENMLTFIAVTWVLLVVFITILVIRYVKKLQRISSDRISIPRQSTIDYTSEQKKEITAIHEIPNIEIQMAVQDKNLQQDYEGNKIDIIESDNSPHVDRSFRSRSLSVNLGADSIKKVSVATLKTLKAFKLNSRMKCMSIITWVYAACTLPMILNMVLANASRLPENGYVIVIPPYLFLYLYTVAMPVVLIKYVPHVKTIVVVFIGKLFNTH